VDVNGDRTLTLNYTPVNSKQLDNKDIDVIVTNISKLWGFPVTLIDDGDRNDIIATTKSIF